MSMTSLAYIVAWHPISIHLSKHGLQHNRQQCVSQLQHSMLVAQLVCLFYRHTRTCMFKNSSAKAIYVRMSPATMEGPEMVTANKENV